MTSTRLRLLGSTADIGRRRGLAAGGLLGILLVLLALTVLGGEWFGVLLFGGVTALIACILGLRDPVLATMYLLVASFLRLALPDDVLPVDPILPAFAGVVVAAWIWARPRGDRLPAFGPVEIAIALYVIWNAASIITPHLYPAYNPLDGTSIPVTRFVLTGIIMPLTMFLVGRTIFATESAADRLTWALLALGGYSAFVSIMQFHGPAPLVWPRFILEDPNWPGRAVGVFNQPVVNGLVLIVGFLIALLVAFRPREARAVRALALVIAVASVYAIYLTHTRAVWLSFAVVVLAGVVTARGFRAGFVATALTMVLAVTVNWSNFISSDRSAGGVASTNEINDRLNMLATSFWALQERPLAGWGIGRFTTVNTYHHQQWSPEVPWQRGYGLSSHFDVLGVAVELGVIGALLWVTVLLLIGARLVDAVRRLPSHGRDGRFALTAMLCFGALLVTGLTVDLRFFDFPNIVVMLMAGAAVGLARHDRSGVDPRAAGGTNGTGRALAGSAAKPERSAP